MTTINTNISAYYAQNNLRAAGAASQSSIAKLSSGQRIIKASDDVAALSIGTILRTNVSTLKTALVNANQGSTLLQIADGALARVGEILQRQKALATQTNSGTLSATEKGYLNQEFSKLKEELDRIVTTTNFNGVKLLDGALAADNTTLATEAPTALVAAVDDGVTVDTDILVGGEAAFALGNAGTAGNETINKLIGSLADVTVVGDLSTDGSDDLVNFIVNINGVNFRSADIDTDAGSDRTDVVFTATDGSGVTFTLDIEDPAASFSAGAVTQTEVDDFAELLQAELAKLNIYQDRTLEDTAATDSSAITAEKFNGTVLQGMDGSDIQLVGKEFADGYAPSISGFKITSMSSTAFKAEVTINGVTYSTANEPGSETGVTIANDADFTDQDIQGAGNGVIRMVSANDANSYIDINLASAAATLDGRSQSLMDGIQNALNGAFGSGSEGGVDVQVGVLSTDKIAIQLDSVKSNALYVDNDGAAVTMDLVSGDIGDIQEALDNAIKTVTARRADVGALQSRFGYAAAALEVSVQNLDAARAQFLDPDISEESTNFAKSQVLQQAAISVLAQANQIPQNLLKLIG